MDHVITSGSNQNIKRLRRLLSSSKMRREENTYVAEGIHLVASFLDAGRTPNGYVVAKSAIENPEISDLLSKLDTMPAEFMVVSDELFTSLTTIHASVGILILFSPDQKAVVLGPLKENTVLLENIQDPGNLGTILRTAAAVGIKNIVLSDGCASPWSPKALRAGMGAQFSLNIHEDPDIKQVISESTIPSLVTSLADDSEMLYDLDLREPVAWIFGSEGQGVSDELAQLATKRVTIPQAESSVESLNVAASVAVCLYEQYRQNSAY